MHSLKAVFSEVIGIGLCPAPCCPVDPEAAHKSLLPFGSRCFRSFYWRPGVLGAGSMTVRKQTRAFTWSREILAWSLEEGERRGTFLWENAGECAKLILASVTNQNL